MSAFNSFIDEQVTRIEVVFTLGEQFRGPKTREFADAMLEGKAYEEYGVRTTYFVDEERGEVRIVGTMLPEKTEETA